MDAATTCTSHLRLPCAPSTVRLPATASSGWSPTSLTVSCRLFRSSCTSSHVVRMAHPTDSSLRVRPRHLSARRALRGPGLCGYRLYIRRHPEQPQLLALLCGLPGTDHLHGERHARRQRRERRAPAPVRMDATLLGFRAQVGAPGCLGLTDAAASSFPIARAPMVAGNSLPIKMLKLASPPAGWPLATSLLTSLVLPSAGFGPRLCQPARPGGSRV